MPTTAKPKLKLKCPNCNQTEKGFRLYVSTGYISACNGYISTENREVSVVIGCLDSVDGEGNGCRYIGPREEFEEAATDENNENTERNGTGTEGNKDGEVKG